MKIVSGQEEALSLEQDNFVRLLEKRTAGTEIRILGSRPQTWEKDKGRPGLVRDF